MKINFKYLLFILAAFFSLAVCVSVSADNTGAINYSYAAAGVEFKAYKVGEVNSDGGFSLYGDFKVYPVLLDDEAAAVTLAAYAARDNISAASTASTNSGKVAVFSGLAKGIYLITGDTAVVDDIKYTPSPILVNVSDNVLNVTGKYEYEVVSTPSSGEGGGGTETTTDEYIETTTSVYEESSETTTKRGTVFGGGGSSSVSYAEISVLKVWEGEKADSITMQLLQDGEVYDEVKLSSSNNWRYTWDKLSKDYTWSVAEKEVPDGYTVKIEKDGTVYIVTNTSDDYVEEEKETAAETETSEAETEKSSESNPESNNSNTHNTDSDDTHSENPDEAVSESEDTDEEVTVDDSGSMSGDIDKMFSSRDGQYPPGSDDSDGSGNGGNGEKLPQTGQLWWPVCAAACAGILLIIIGIGFKRSGENNEE